METCQSRLSSDVSSHHLQHSRPRAWTALPLFARRDSVASSSSGALSATAECHNPNAVGNVFSSHQRDPFSTYSSVQSSPDTFCLSSLGHHIRTPPSGMWLEAPSIDGTSSITTSDSILDFSELIDSNIVSAPSSWENDSLSTESFLAPSLSSGSQIASIHSSAHQYTGIGQEHKDDFRLQGSAASSPSGRRLGYTGYNSKAIIDTAADSRRQHRKSEHRFYCRVDGCPRSEGYVHSDDAGGKKDTERYKTSSRKSWFTSKKDCERHEAMHSPQVRCAWEGCGRVFSRLDNMKDHVRRIHGGTKRRRKNQDEFDYTQVAAQPERRQILPQTTHGSR